MIKLAFLVALVNSLLGFGAAILLERRVIVPFIRLRKRRHEDESGGELP